VAYGTWEGNLWLARMKDSAPVRIDNGKVTAGSEEFTGANLRLIVSFAHPDNPDSAVLAYTAERASDVPGINGVIHGGTGYVVADGLNILKAGRYRLTPAGWRLE
jgi:hypothetical protein